MNNVIKVRFSLQVGKETIFATLLFVALMFLLLDFIQFSYADSIPRKLGKIVDITSEGNLPTLYSSLLAIASGLVALVIWKHYSWLSSPRDVLSWGLIATFFVYLGVDDAAQIHERVATVVSQWLKADNTGRLASTFLGFESYYWQALFGPVFALFGLYMLVYLKKAFADNKVFFYFLAGIGFYVVAVLLDYIDGVPKYYDYFLTDTLSFAEIQHLFRALEEYIEMVGNSFILVSFLLHASNLQESQA